MTKTLGSKNKKYAKHEEPIWKIIINIAALPASKSVCLHALDTIDFSFFMTRKKIFYLFENYICFIGFKFSFLAVFLAKAKEWLIPCSCELAQPFGKVAKAKIVFTLKARWLIYTTAVEAG